MRRRQPDPSAAALQVPEEIAEGCRVSRWADLRHLELLEAMGDDDPGRAERVQWTKLSAFRRYRLAEAQWSAETQVGRQQRFESRRQVWRRTPYFDKPGTPLPPRIGYAAEPEATNRTWDRVLHPER